MTEPEVEPYTRQASHVDDLAMQPESGASPEVRKNQVPGEIDRDRATSDDLSR